LCRDGRHLHGLGGEQMGIGLKLARNAVCRACTGYRHCPLWNWSRCKHKGVDAIGDPMVEMNDAFMDGPESNCPQTRWVGVKAKTDAEMAAEAKAHTEEVSAGFIARNQPFIDRMADAVEMKAALGEMVVAGHMSDALQTQVLKDLGLVAIAK